MKETQVQSRPNIPKSYEELVQLSGGRDSANIKLMQFYKPLTAEEKQLHLSMELMGASGKIIYVFGPPGSGKSTFVESLAYRPHLKIHAIKHLSIQMHKGDEGLNELLGLIDEAGKEGASKLELGTSVVVLDYLESLDGFSGSAIKSFFQGLNGILRQNKILVLWPIVKPDDLTNMKRVSQDVSGTMFIRGYEVLNIAGPTIEEFPAIAETTIKVMNDGKTLEDITLTKGELEDISGELTKLPSDERKLRRYYELIDEKWIQNTNYISDISRKTPKPSEVWIVFPYPGAESVVRNFSRKGRDHSSAWLASHDALHEYIGTSQRASFWDAKKLQLAISGVITTRLFYHPTHSLLCGIRAYSENTDVNKIIDENAARKKYNQKAKAISAIKTTPIYRQIVNELPGIGKRKSGPAAKAELDSNVCYDPLTKWISSGKGSDKPLNGALSKCLKDALSGRKGMKIFTEKPHPYIPNIQPDIMLDDGEKVICIEFHYTNQHQPNIIADYTLEKLKKYMEQINLLIAK
jgi:hypothetical protein